ncbi:MAG: ribbon-helix-helix domain-containing protein [Nanoarchaeota archaeon]
MTRSCRLSIYLPQDVLAQADRLIAQDVYASRSHILRVALKRLIEAEQDRAAQEAKT